jgi:two-component system nitrate/nitrite response regulator NarL
MHPTWQVRVAVVSDQPLVADVIAAALTHGGFACSRPDWPAGVQASPRAPRADVALLVSDLDGASRIRGAVQLVSAVPACWVVLTQAPRGPVWGALLELGVVHVASSSTGLDEVVTLLGTVADGRALTGREERAALVRSWRDLLREHEDVVARLATMTPRETQVLQLLSAGSPPREIAHELGVAEATVRTQVKRLLRKLDVRSQLGAVAAFEHVRRTETTLAGDDPVVSTMWLGRQLGPTPRPAR